KNIPMERIAAEVFLVRESGSGTRIAMEKLFDNMGLKMRLGMEITRNETIKQAVRAGLGLSVVSQHTIALELETGWLRALDVVGCQIISLRILIFWPALK
ncbi:hypothetical protein TI04_08370, partial [Achromatium sp. WMS2]